MLLSPAEIGKLIFKSKWQEPKHIQLLNSLVSKLAERKFYRLIVNIPPRYGKSTITSILFPFWYIGNFPDHNLLLVTYQNRLAQLWGKRIRQLIQTYGAELFNIALDNSDRSATSMTIAGTNGNILCVGAGGLLTGMGANAIIVDDPIKNNKEALSPLQRDSLWEWFKATLYTRLEPDGVLLIVMTRWHEDDIVGRLLASNSFIEINNNIHQLPTKTQSSSWLLLKLPALAKDNDPLGREIGEPLWKERFDLNSILEQKKILGDFWFSALYQQEPIFTTGKIFHREKFQYFDLVNNIITITNSTQKITSKEHILLSSCSIFATVDLAIKSSERSDYTVAIVFAISGKKDVFLLEIFREKFDATDHLSLLQTIYSRWKPLLIGVESVQYQYTLVQNARRIGLPVKELRADRDKIARSLVIANWIDAGKVFFRKDTTWLDEFERELIQFPDGAHDDQVDAFSYIAQLIEPISTSRIKGISKKNPNDMLSLFD
ncbi:MAG: phage terminase large subunit [Ignavibacteria bacterium]|nr:phage terminase large subunit [Ignavibacteria bacterium]